MEINLLVARKILISAAQTVVLPLVNQARAAAASPAGRQSVAKATRQAASANPECATRCECTKEQGVWNHPLQRCGSKSTAAARHPTELDHWAAMKVEQETIHQCKRLEARLRRFPMVAPVTTLPTHPRGDPSSSLLPKPTRSPPLSTSACIVALSHCSPPKPSQNYPHQNLHLQR